jgi:DNA-binding MarR family transcriptional regulator
MPLSWYDVLLELNAAPERRLRMTDLGERVVLSRTRVSRLVDEIATAGLVVREQNPQDGRSAYATLTTEGLRRYRKAAPTYLAAIEQHFSSKLDDDQLRTISTALQRVLSR